MTAYGPPGPPPNQPNPPDQPGPPNQPGLPNQPGPPNRPGPGGGPVPAGRSGAAGGAGAAGGPAAAGSGKAKRPFSTGQILGGILFVLVIVFIVENSRSVKIRLLIPEVKAPLYIAILIAAVLGALIAWLLRYRRHRNHPPR